MKTLWLKILITAIAGLALGACGHAKNGADVAKDTNAAAQKAAADNAKVQHDAEQKEAAVADRSKDDARELAHETAVQEQKIAQTQAEGEHRIALAHCESLSGKPQKSCKDEADARYDIAKAKADLARAEADPKP